MSQSSLSRSTSILMSSGMAKEGWVSFSWMATCREGVGSQAGIQTKAMVAVLCPFRAPSAWFQAGPGCGGPRGGSGGQEGEGGSQVRCPSIEDPEQATLTHTPSTHFLIYDMRGQAEAGGERRWHASREV